MKEFEEQFPSLKDKFYKDSFKPKMVATFHVIETIQENCIDKQKLKDWINECLLPRLEAKNINIGRELKELGI